MPCNKISYETKQAALANASNVRHAHLKFSKNWRTNADKYKRLRPYECSACGKWHLTTQKQKRKDRNWKTY